MQTRDSELPADLPIPADDGAADHLQGTSLPDVILPATDGANVSLSALQGCWVIYIYPLTGHPDTPLPDGWNDIPGARGCTPQACGFRDHYSELQALQSRVCGLSTQTSEYQREAKGRLHLPFELLSDHDLQLKTALRLPTFSIDGMELYKRLTLIVIDSVIRKVFYPVFPPDRNVDEVLAWLEDRK